MQLLFGKVFLFFDCPESLKGLSVTIGVVRDKLPQGCDVTVIISMSLE